MRWPWNPPVPSRSDRFGTPAPYPWWRRNWVVLAAGLAVVIGLLVWKLVPWRECGPGMSYNGSVCVGLDLTSSSFKGDDPLRGLESTIASDNAKITGSYFATIVYLDDMEPNPLNDSVAPNVLKHRVEGAITAEREVNDTTIAGSDTLKIKLLLANYGDGATDAGSVMKAILQANRDGQRIVAVTGIGQSLVTTRQAIQKLSAAGITTVGSVISGDDMNLEPNGQPIENFFRVSSTDLDEARTAASYIGKRYKKIMLIKDTNPGDIYGQNLAADFSNELQQAYPAGPFNEQYESPEGPLTDATRYQDLLPQFTPMRSDICSYRPDLIYFAGRGDDLRTFLTVLVQSSCPGLDRVDVLSDDDANTLLGAPLPQSDSLTYRVFYTALATTGEWKLVPGDTTDAANYKQFVDGFTNRDHFNVGDLSDGHAIMEYDALLTAATAVRGIPAAVHNPRALRSAFFDFNCTHLLPGASGQIAFYSNTRPIDGQGNAIDKAVPIVQVGSDGQVIPQVMEWSDRMPFSDRCG